MNLRLELIGAMVAAIAWDIGAASRGVPAIAPGGVHGDCPAQSSNRLVGMLLPMTTSIGTLWRLR